MTTAKRSLPLFCALSLVLVGGAAGCGVSVEADLPEVEVTQHDLAFDGVPQAGLVGDVSETRSFSQQHKTLELPKGLDSEVKALGVTMTAKTGVQDLAFLHNVRVLMTDDVHEPIELLDYQQDATARPGSVLSMVSANPVNTLDQWKTSSATFTVEVAGALPPSDWTVDLAIDFSGKVKYSY